jgi:hypothetical protein
MLGRHATAPEAHFDTAIHGLQRGQVKFEA